MTNRFLVLIYNSTFLLLFSLNQFLNSLGFSVLPLSQWNTGIPNHFTPQLKRHQYPRTELTGIGFQLDSKKYISAPVHKLIKVQPKKTDIQDVSNISAIMESVLMSASWILPLVGVALFLGMI